MKKKLIIAVAFALALGCAFGATFAYLATKDTIQNTFVVGNVDVELTETEGGESHEFPVVPGSDIDKTAIATVKANSAACYLFVELTPSENFPAFLTYAPNKTAGWQAVEGEDGVYYISVEKKAEDQSFHVLEDDEVALDEDLMTKEAVDALEGVNPTLDITVYAVQKDGLDLAGAWTAAQALND